MIVFLRLIKVSYLHHLAFCFAITPKSNEFLIFYMSKDDFFFALAGIMLICAKTLTTLKGIINITKTRDLAYQ